MVKSELGKGRKGDCGADDECFNAPSSIGIAHAILGQVVNK